MKANQDELKLYSTYCKYLGYTATTNNLQSLSKLYMKHATKSLNQSFMSNYKLLNQLTINPISSTTTTTKEHKSKPGRRVSDIGKIAPRYSESDISKVAKLLNEKEKQSQNESTETEKLLSLEHQCEEIS